ncbi:hypothetical protein [Phenylobacterium sp.]|uniref:hypothetical protein n=1 Tax=Phenylobacterium sp. TaxID=1871053 RepID=UPI002733F401|nr:hypothetical protein [Phenylobacterium sp.]MDP3659628.1 hypothetical protein [Phenylobacterium sp.]
MLLISGYTGDAAPISKFLADGMEMMTKPFGFEQLKAKIRSMTTRPGPSRDAQR